MSCCAAVAQCHADTLTGITHITARQHTCATKSAGCPWHGSLRTLASSRGAACDSTAAGSVSASRHCCRPALCCCSSACSCFLSTLRSRRPAASAAASRVASVAYRQEHMLRAAS